MRRDRTLARHLSERILGPAQPYLLHLRPSAWPIMGLHTAVGWLLAAGFGLPGRQAVIGIGAWVICLAGGSLALNSAFDRDRTDIAFLRDPPEAPPGLAVFGAALMALGLVLTWRLPGGYRAVYVLCTAMSIAFSVPPLRLKTVAGANWVICMLGLGTFSPAAAWAIAGRSLGGTRALVLWSFCPLFAGLYPLLQLRRQQREDRGSGELPSHWFGPRRSIEVAMLCVGFAFGMLAMAGWLSGWRTHADLARWAALVAAACAWLAVVTPWYSSGTDWSGAQYDRAMCHALAAWALTDAAVVLGWVM